MTPEQKAARFLVDREAIDYAFELWLKTPEIDEDMNFGQFLQWIEFRNIGKRIKELNRSVGEVSEMLRTTWLETQGK